MTEPRWLSAVDQRAWRSYLSGSQLLSAQLDKELREKHGIGLPEYEILVRLSEHEDRTMRMALLATDTTMSRSRLTHSVARMEKRGLLERSAIAEDGRGVNCVMTEAGWQLLRTVAPDHVAGVRDPLLPPLQPQQTPTPARTSARPPDHLRELRGSRRAPPRFRDHDPAKNQRSPHDDSTDARTPHRSVRRTLRPRRGRHPRRSQLPGPRVQGRRRHPPIHHRGDRRLAACRRRHRLHRPHRLLGRDAPGPLPARGAR